MATTPVLKHDRQLPCRFMKLPEGVQAKIIELLLEEADVQQPAPAPALTANFIQNRAPMVNNFDLTRPTVTNIYVDRFCLFETTPARCLASTSWTLRRTVHRIIENVRSGNADNAEAAQSNNPTSEIRKGNHESPTSIRPTKNRTHVLDVMLVKDVGLFPTWLTPPLPWRTHADLKVQIRIVQPERGLFPQEWIEAAHHKQTDDDSKGKLRSRWSLMTVLSLFATDSLTWSYPCAQDYAHADLRKTRNIYLGKVNFEIHPKEYRADGTELKRGNERYLDRVPEGYAPFAGGFWDEPGHVHSYYDTYDLALRSCGPTEKASLQLCREIGKTVSAMRVWSQARPHGNALGEDIYVNRTIYGISEAYVSTGEIREKLFRWFSDTVYYKERDIPENSWEKTRQRKYSLEEKTEFPCCCAGRVIVEASKDAAGTKKRKRVKTDPSEDVASMKRVK